MQYGIYRYITGITVFASFFLIYHGIYIYGGDVQYTRCSKYLNYLHFIRILYD